MATHWPYKAPPPLSPILQQFHARSNVPWSSSTLLEQFKAPPPPGCKYLLKAMLADRSSLPLLQVALALGQAGVAKYLVDVGCDSNLTTDELKVFLAKVAWEKCWRAAEIANSCARNRDPLVLVRKTGWWCRKGSVNVLHASLIDRIAFFALAVPPPVSDEIRCATISTLATAAKAMPPVEAWRTRWTCMSASFLMA